MPNQQKCDEFRKITDPVIEWLNENGNPHMIILIDPTGAVLYSGETAYITYDHVKG